MSLITIIIYTVISLLALWIAWGIFLACISIKRNQKNKYRVVKKVYYDGKIIYCPQWRHNFFYNRWHNLEKRIRRDDGDEFRPIKCNKPSEAWDAIRELKASHQSNYDNFMSKKIIRKQIMTEEALIKTSENN